MTALAGPVDATQTGEKRGPPSTIAGRYRIVGVLGGGAMAEVFEVVDESRGVTVALKRLLPDRGSGRTATLLFQREYETLTQLSHPLIVRAFEYGIDGSLPFYTMERLVGRNLSDLSPMPWRAAASLLRDVASALSLVHSRKLVHRDVSSRNVCRTEEGRAKLIDFGALGPMGPQREIIGTPPFLCPESLEQRPLDARADLFSLGALAYFALTGRHAYPARRVAELGEMWRRPIESPSRIVPDVPETLAALVLSLIDLNPLVRPGSAAEVYDRLSAIAELPSVEAPETARAYFLTPGLVARADQSQRFRRRLLRAERGRGETLLIESPRGGGRSRLLSSFLLDARLRGAIVVSVDCNHLWAAPFAAVRALARGIRDTEPSLASELASSDPELSRLLAIRPGAASDAEAEIPPENWVAASERVAAWFVELSRKRLVVIGVDDVDACDGPSAAVVAALASAASSEAMLVVATCVTGSDAPAATRLRDNGSSLSLKAFLASETRELMSSVFGEVPHVDTVASWVHDLSNGLPSTALELAQHLVDSGLARYGQGGWGLPASLQGLGLPESVDAALDARVAALSPAARLIAEALSLASSSVPLLVSEYPALLDEGTKSEFFLHLNELVSGSVLVDAGSTYVFSSRETRDAVLRHVPKEGAPALHRRLAAAYQSGVEPADDLAAHHLLEAGDLEPAFRLFVEACRTRSDAFARGMSFYRTPEGAAMIERLYAWGRANGAVAEDQARVTRTLMQAASLGDKRLARYAPEVLESLRRDSGLDLWQTLEGVVDPLERIQRAIGEAYERYAASPDRERRLDPSAAITELAMVSSGIIGVYVRNADHVGGTALDELVRPLRVFSPVLDLLSRLLELAARALRGNETRQLRVEVAERTLEPVPGLDEPARVNIQVLSQYYLALEDMTQGYPVPDERLTLLDRSAPYAPLAWQARMLREYYRGDERKAEACRRHRDIAMTGRADVDGHLETSVLYESGAYATLGNLMALKRLLPLMEERSAERPGWRPYHRLAVGNCDFLRGDYESAIAEYEAGLALPDVSTHASQTLLLVRLVRALVELGRFGEAKKRAEATLERHRAEPLGPFYVDELEVALACAEAGAGDVAQAIARADRAMTRIEERGLSGVVLVNFLTQSAVLAHRVRDNRRFESLLERVAVLVKGTDSTALASQYARLLSMRQSTTFEPVAAPIGGALLSSVHTELGANVRTELERCEGPHERSRRALQFLMTYSGAARGFLYLYRSGRLEFTAAIPEEEPGATLEARLNEWVSVAFESEGMTATASLDTNSSPPIPSTFAFVELTTSVQGALVLAGVAALEASRGTLARVPNDVLRTLCGELVRTGDAVGRPIFARDPS